MRYADLRTAGRDLAARLEPYRARPDRVVLGIVRGGVPAAVEVATHLDAPLDLLLLRPLLQRPSGDPIRAARVAGTLVLEKDLVPANPESVEGWFVRDALESFAERELVCRGPRPPLDVAGKSVILVDNGVRTGGTMCAAIRAVRELHAASVVVAVPVAAPSSRAVVEAAADAFICLRFPEPFGHVGMFYGRFAVPSDTEVNGLLAESGLASTNRQIKGR